MQAIEPCGVTLNDYLFAAIYRFFAKLRSGMR
jgi:hypothetical protein